MKRTRLRRRSARQEAYLADRLPERDAWARSMPRCWVCGQEDGIWTWPDRIVVVELDTHEMVPRGQYTDWAHPWNYFRVCRMCHESVQFSNEWPLARQLAKKMIEDPDNYDCRRAFVARYGAETQLGQADVDAWLWRLDA